MPTCCCSWHAPGANSQLIGGGLEPPASSGGAGERLLRWAQSLCCPVLPLGARGLISRAKKILQKNTLRAPVEQPEHRFCPLYSSPCLQQAPWVIFWGLCICTAAYECLYPHTPCHGAQQGCGQSSLSQPPRGHGWGQAVALGGLWWPSGRPSAQPASGPGRRAAASPGG